MSKHRKYQQLEEEGVELRDVASPSRASPSRATPSRTSHSRATPSRASARIASTREASSSQASTSGSGEQEETELGQLEESTNILINQAEGESADQSFEVSIPCSKCNAVECTCSHNKKTQAMYRILLVILLFIIAGLTVALIASRVQLTKWVDDMMFMDSDVCTTAECVKTGASTLMALDMDVEPCEDFYKYSCGGWDQKHASQRAEQHYYTAVTKALDDTKILIKEALEAPISSVWPMAIHEAQNVYTRCMGTDLLRAQKGEPMAKLIREIAFWPLITPIWREEMFNLEETLANLHLVAVQVLFTSQPNFPISDAPKTLMLAANFGYMPGNLTNDVDHSNYIDFISELVYYLHPIRHQDRTSFKAEIKESVEDMVELESRLNKFYSTAFSSWDLMTGIAFPVDQLYTNVTHKFDWKVYIAELFSGMDYNYIWSNKPVILRAGSSYFPGLMDILDETPKRTMANYLVFKLILKFLPFIHLSQELEQCVDKVAPLLPELRAMVSKKELPRWKRCVELTEAMMPMAVSRLFIDHYSNESKTAEVEDLVDNVINFNMVSRSVEKNEVRKWVVGALDWIKDDDALDEHYNLLVVGDKSTSLLWDAVQGTRLFAIHQFDAVTRSSSVNEKLVSTSLEVCYEPTNKTLWIPEAILQLPFYDVNRPMSMNLGALGAVIGHKFSHEEHTKIRVGFGEDPIADAFGPSPYCISPKDNWYLDPFKAAESKNEYRLSHISGEKLKHHQYGLNRALLLLKSLGDSKEFDLPGLETFNSDKLFFISYAQMFCGAHHHHPDNDDKEFERIYRINEIVQEYPAFHEAFSCSNGTNSQ